MKAFPHAGADLQSVPPTQSKLYPISPSHPRNWFCKQSTNNISTLALTKQNQIKKQNSAKLPGSEIYSKYFFVCSKQDTDHRSAPAV